MALGHVRLRDWARVFRREIVTGLALAAAVAAQEPLVRIAGPEFAATATGVRQAGFTLKTLPAGPLFIHLKLKAGAPAAAAAAVEVRLNGKPLFQGPAALSSDYWRITR